MRDVAFSCLRHAAVLLLVVAAVATHAAPVPPELPEYFTASFTEFTAYNASSPPYENGIPQAPFKASRGQTFYDWRVKGLIEKRFDYCVNIFPTMKNDFPCTFWDINGTSYLTSVGAPHLPKCCVFGQPWYPPPPDFLRKRVNSTYGGAAPWNQGTANWFVNYDIPPPAGPFWWSFRDGEVSPQVYSSFSFPGIEGWVQQNFFGVQTYPPPPASTWTVPAECLPVDKLPNCGFFGAQMPAHRRHFFSRS